MIDRLQDRYETYANGMQVDGDGNFDCLASMGFSMLHSFEEVNCDAATWTMMHAS